MYTRAYGEDVGEIIIPEKYGGTSFGANAADNNIKATSEQIDTRSKNPWENEDTIHTSNEPESEKEIPTSAAVGKSPFPSFLSNIFKNKNFGLQKIGTEEILIVATAIFLLFSKEGDRECAIMLLLLLFMG